MRAPGALNTENTVIEKQQVRCSLKSPTEGERQQENTEKYRKKDAKISPANWAAEGSMPLGGTGCSLLCCMNSANASLETLPSVSEQRVNNGTVLHLTGYDSVKAHSCLT